MKAAFELQSPLTAEERAEKRKLIVQDVISLLSLSAVTAVLALLTYLLFNSFIQHRQGLTQRWLARGNASLAAGQPEQATESFRSALEYAPDQRETEIKLATALAEAGHTEASIAYFNSLLEAQPGNGPINLELARLAVKQHHTLQGVEYYQRALDGTWNGDGYKRRLSVRMELAHYLLDQQDFPRGRSQLLIAAGNAPDDPQIKIAIAASLEQAQDPASALDIYQNLAERKGASVEAFEGAGRTEFTLGHFVRARAYLERSINHPDFSSQSELARNAILAMLADSNRIILLFPSPDLKVKERAERILQAMKIARARLDACTVTNEGLAALVGQWEEFPQNMRPLVLARDPQMEQTAMKLVFDTEKETAKICGAPDGDDALLLKISRTPWATE